MLCVGDRVHPLVKQTRVVAFGSVQANIDHSRAARISYALTSLVATLNIKQLPSSSGRLRFLLPVLGVQGDDALRRTLLPAFYTFCATEFWMSFE